VHIFDSSNLKNLNLGMTPMTVYIISCIFIFIFIFFLNLSYS
jgi:hypothetical protein